MVAAVADVEAEGEVCYNVRPAVFEGFPGFVRMVSVALVEAREPGRTVPAREKQWECLVRSVAILLEVEGLEEELAVLAHCAAAASPVPVAPLRRRLVGQPGNRIS